MQKVSALSFLCVSVWLRDNMRLPRERDTYPNGTLYVDEAVTISGTAVLQTIPIRNESLKSEPSS